MASSTITLPAAEVDIQILGPLRVLWRGAELTVGTRREQALLTLLALGVNRVQPAQQLLDRLWDGAPPEGAATTLRSYISHLRSNLGGPSGLGGRLVTRGSGYLLELEPASIDANRFRTLVTSGQASLEADPLRALDNFDRALTMWRGQPLAELADHQVAIPVLAELLELHTGAAEGRLSALVETGRHREALPALEALVIEEPLRETPRLLHMLALYRDGRAPAALDVHTTYRQLLADELGIDPSPNMDVLYRRILLHDASLEVPTPSAVPSASGPGAAIQGDPVDTVVLATQLVAALQELVQTVSNVAIEIVEALNRDRPTRPHLESVRTATGA